MREIEARRKPVEKVETPTIINAPVKSNDKSTQISEADALLSVSKTKLSNAITPVLIPADAVHTICNYEGIKVQVIIFDIDIESKKKFLIYWKFLIYFLI